MRLGADCAFKYELHHSNGSPAPMLSPLLSAAAAMLGVTSELRDGTGPAHGLPVDHPRLLPRRGSILQAAQQSYDVSTLSSRRSIALAPSARLRQNWDRRLGPMCCGRCIQSTKSRSTFSKFSGSLHGRSPVSVRYSNHTTIATDRPFYWSSKFGPEGPSGPR